MKSTDLAKRWSVYKNTENNTRCYVYVPEKEYYDSEEHFLEDMFEDYADLFVEVPFDEWTSYDLSEIFGNDLEDANEHRWTWMPNILLAELKNCGIQEKECFNILLGMYMSWLTY